MNKTIYVKDEDTELFNNADKLLGVSSISEAIAKSLKIAAKQKELQELGMKSYILKCSYYSEGSSVPELQPPSFSIRFVGRPLASTEVDGLWESGVSYEAWWTVYKTVGDKFILTVKVWTSDTGLKTIPPTVTIASVHQEISEIEGKVFTNVGTYGELAAPERLVEAAKNSLAKDSSIFIE